MHERQFNFAPPTALLALLNAKFGRLGPGWSTGYIKDVHVGKSHQCKSFLVLFLMYFVDGAVMTNLVKFPNLYWIIQRGFLKEVSVEKPRRQFEFSYPGSVCSHRLSPPARGRLIKGDRLADLASTFAGLRD